MNVLDENIIAPERERLRSWRIHFRRIGGELGRAGMKDLDDVIPLLHALKRPTFFTRDHDFYTPELRHAGYCLVYLDVVADETGDYIRRFLRHRACRTQTQRMGKVIRLHPIGLSYWQLGSEKERSIRW